MDLITIKIDLPTPTKPPQRTAANLKPGEWATDAYGNIWHRRQGDEVICLDRKELGTIRNPGSFLITETLPPGTRIIRTI